MGADAEADEGLLAQAKDNDKISGYLGRWKAYLPLSTDGMCRMKIWRALLIIHLGRLL